MATQARSGAINVFENTKFPEDVTIFPNPERGWYRTMETEDASQFELLRFRENNITLVGFETNLAAYINRPLDAQKLNEIDRAFLMARRAGLSIIFRAAYDFNGRREPEPKDINIILNHISQLRDLFYKYEDVLFNVQAGFLGSWGEWHSTYYGDGLWAPPRVDYQRIIGNALLEAVPESVTVSVRRPEYVRNIAGKEPLTSVLAFGNSKIARMGFHNDALMSEESDMDTYVDPDYPRDSELAWINNHTRYTPFIGETNKTSRYNDTNNAIPFLDLMNAHSLNFEYHPNVLSKWKNSKYGGINAHDYISLMLGYRFVLNDVSLSQQVQSGGILQLDLELMNTGFGHLLREKKFEIVLKNNNRLIRAGIDEDARFWDKNELINRTYRFQLPSNIPAGDWEVYLGLTSTYETLRDNPAYSVRFANLNVWDENLGLNKIGSIRVTAGQSGGSEEFRQVK